MIKTVSLLALNIATSSFSIAQPTDHLVFEGSDGPGKGKHIVFLAGDEEYRSEEFMPMMAQVMANHGFKCTVLFSMDANGKFVNPNNQKSLSNAKALDSADAIVMALRFRKWEDTAMEKFHAAFERGTPIVALRTSTHAFNFPANSKWAKYSWNSSPQTGWDKGFGREVLGETWINHHGKHKVEGARGVIEEANKNHAVLNGVGSMFALSDVYGITKAQPNGAATILLRGEVTKSLDPKSPAVEGHKNAPMMPVAWVKEYKNAKGNTNKILTTTMGAAVDLKDENLRRLIANGIYWGLNMEVPKKADVTIKGQYKPTMYGFNTWKKNMTPADFVIRCNK